jgi:predicted dienelactone hydrolase
MRFLLFIFLLPLTLAAFEPQPISPHPVVGFSEIPLENNRKFSAWYPVAQQEADKPSANPWDVFYVALNAQIFPSNSKIPVIILSHGYMGNPRQLSWMIRGLVEHGFIVLGIQHDDLINGRAHINHWRRAQEISRMIDAFTKSPLAERADLQKIGITGYSLGGTTAVWIAGGRSTKLDSIIPGPEYASTQDYTRADEALPTLDKGMMGKDWRDKRVKAAFVMAPAWAWLFDEDSLKKVSTPCYFIAAAGDKVLVAQNNAGYFARNIPQAYFQEIPGKAGHYIFITALDSEQRKKADPSGALRFLFEDDVFVDRRWIQLQVAGEAADFFHSVFQTFK